MSEGNQPVPSSSNLVWMDLEMTGLDAQTEVILQAAVIVTNSELEPLEEFATDVWQPASALQTMNPFVRQMHEKSGLLKSVESASPELPDVRDAEQKLLGIVAKWCAYPATLCGNSIWQDRKFIDRYMPGLGRYLGYRMVDVSSLKVLAGRWYGDDAVYVKPKAGEHTALVDIRNSIAELRHYRDTLLKKPLG